MKVFFFLFFIIILQAQNNNINNIKNKANEYFLYGDYKMANIEYSKLIEFNPNDVQSYYKRAFSKEKLNNEVGAVEDYSKVIEIDKNNAYAYFKRGKIYEVKNHNEKAFEDFNNSVKLDSLNHEFLFYRGLMYFKLGKENLACSDWQKSTDISNMNRFPKFANCNAKENKKQIDQENNIIKDDYFIEDENVKNNLNDDYKDYNFKSSNQEILEYKQKIEQNKNNTKSQTKILEQNNILEKDNIILQNQTENQKKEQEPKILSFDDIIQEDNQKSIKKIDKINKNSAVIDYYPERIKSNTN